MADIQQLEDSIVSLSLLEASALVKKLEERLGVSAAAAVAAPAAGGGAAAAAPVEEKTEFTVILKDARREQDQRPSRLYAKSPPSASRKPRTWSTALPSP